VPSALILPFHALVWAARALARHGDALAAGVRAALAEDDAPAEEAAAAMEMREAAGCVAVGVAQQCGACGACPAAA
jgi:hypothetical protein